MTQHSHGMFAGAVGEKDRLEKREERSDGMTVSEAMDYIRSFQKSGKPVHDLSRISALLDELNNPQDKLSVVHIAGTNGKGSVAAFCSASAAAAGFRVGTLTSPFVRHYTDRIQINGQDIPDAMLCTLCQQVKNCSVSAECSQFEITFAIALLYFLQEQCDLAVLETGIGGLLDATNVVKRPLVCAITSVSYDHMAVLGNTLIQIAAQKAGIIKPSCPVVLSPDNPMNVRCLVEKTAQHKNASFVMPDMRDCRIMEESLEKTVFSYHSFQYTLTMPGRHQVANALTAIEVIRLLGMHGFLISASVTADAISQVQIPARTQVLRQDPMVIVDGGHNQAGVLALTDLLRLAENPHIHGVCGMIDTKDYGTGCGLLRQVLETAFCVDDFSPQAVPKDVLADCFGKIGIEMPSLAAAYDMAVRLAKADGGIVVVCGSLYLASALLHLLDADDPDSRL